MHVGIRAVVLEGCGHVPNRENPRQVLKEVTHFLAQYAIVCLDMTVAKACRTRALLRGLAGRVVIRSGVRSWARLFAARRAGAVHARAATRDENHCCDEQDDWVVRITSLPTGEGPAKDQNA